MTCYVLKTSFHPQSNGCVERFNRTLTNMLTMYCAKDQHNWDENLPQVLLAYRSSVHATTGFTPNFLMFGREIILPLQAVIGRPVIRRTFAKHRRLYSRASMEFKDGP